MLYNAARGAAHALPAAARDAAHAPPARGADLAPTGARSARVPTMTYNVVQCHVVIYNIGFFKYTIVRST